MLSSISPLGQRARTGRWWGAATAYLAGSTLAGGVVGGLLGAIGDATGAARLTHGPAGPALLAAAAVAAAVCDATGRRTGPRRQVDERWLVAYRDWVYGFGYGVQLGAGVVTIIATATILLAGLLAVAVASAAAGAAIGAVFGLARGSMLLTTARVRGADDLRRLMRRHEAARRPAIAAAIATAAATAVIAASAGISGGW